MLDIPAIRDAAADHRRVMLDADGNLRPSGDFSFPDSPAVLIVGDVTEAVKRVEEDAVIGPIDRDELWAVKGFILDREVVDDLPLQLESPADLIEAVKEAGYRWVAIGPTSFSP